MTVLPKEWVENLKKRYPEGTEIVLEEMGKDPNPIPPGTKGIVKHVDDIGTIHCEFENGRTMGLIYGEDLFHKAVNRELDYWR